MTEEQIKAAKEEGYNRALLDFKPLVESVVAATKLMTSLLAKSSIDYEDKREINLLLMRLDQISFDLGKRVNNYP